MCCSPRLIPRLAEFRVVEVACGMTFSVVLTDQGEVRPI